MPFTISKLLNGELRGLRLLAGREALDNEIQNVNVIENPDSYDWFQAGDFLLTTGFIFLDDQEAQIQLVRKLKELGCAGLGVKVKRYWNEVPAALLKEADRLDIPVVELPLDYTLAQISNYINNELHVRESSLIRQYKRIHDSFLHCTLSGGNLSDIVMCLVDLVHNPILLFDSEWRLLDFAETEDAPLLLSHLFKLEKGKRILDQHFTERLPRDIDQFRKSIRRHIRLADATQIQVVVMPVRVEHTTYGYILCPLINREFRHFDDMALEHAVTVIALERSKKQQFDEYKRMVRNDFFEDLLEGRIDSPKTIQRLAELHGMSASRPHLVSVLKLTSVQGQPIADMVTHRAFLLEFMRQMTQTVQESCERLGRHVTIFQRRHKIVLFIQLFSAEGEHGVSAAIMQLMQNIQSQLRAMPEHPEFLIAVSRRTEHLEDMTNAYHQALEAIRIQERLENPEDIAWYDNLMVYQLLESGVPRAFLEDFYLHTIARLEAYDRENESNLTAALRAYIASNGNVSAAAERLFMHRNTMLYRVKKIEEVLNVDLKDWKQILELQLGLYIARMIKRK